MIPYEIFFKQTTSRHAALLTKLTKLPRATTTETTLRHGGRRGGRWIWYHCGKEGFAIETPTFSKQRPTLLLLTNGKCQHQGEHRNWWLLLGKILHEDRRPRVMVSPDFNLPRRGKKQSENEPLSRAHWKLLVPKKFEEISLRLWDSWVCKSTSLSEFLGRAVESCRDMEPQVPQPSVDMQRVGGGNLIYFSWWRPGKYVQSV
jgi:hypothetical protein